ncbi:transcription factor MYB41 [Brachypodium distachyon]|uniref:MYB transcription factor n=1 Tax=Brachypodium distachyon TaxID=15368 RepID=I1GTI5_BRADI|nr:transcription factor MYB41 [Brachypodium distachyon]KQK15782.1 hypothetical protein BRADI_1g24887v3 [Brachypodium distachyon]QTK16915.1 mYB transcription factor [Brachypodium distachyon]|eukprot:XP_003560097.1 transcription factor MYB41 [Brachypodium distachyon]
MGRAPCCDRAGLKKGPWTQEEDEKLVSYIKKHGQGNWRTLPKNAGLERCGKSCRLRWTNYLRPDIKRGRFSFEEEETIIQLHSILGNKWSAIAARLPGRTDNEIKNYWNTHIRKRLLRMGIDPVTHAPRLDFLDLTSLLNKHHHPAATNAYYPTQADLEALRALEPLASYPADLLRLASTLLSPPNQDQQQQQQQMLLMPWLQIMAQQQQQQQQQVSDQRATAAAAHQLLMQQPCGLAAGQMPGLVHHANLQEDHMVPGCVVDYAQPPAAGACYDYVPALMHMVSDADASNNNNNNLQWSSTVDTGSNNNVGSGVSTPSSSPAAGRVNSASTTTTTTTAFGALNDVIAADDADAGLFDMQLYSDLLDVSDYM